MYEKISCSSCIGINFAYRWFLQSYGADAVGHWYGASRLNFTQDGPKETVLWKVQNDGLPDAKYYWGSEEVSADELLKRRGVYAADKVDFQSLNEENITALFLGE